MSQFRLAITLRATDQVAVLSTLWVSGCGKLQFTLIRKKVVGFT